MTPGKNKTQVEVDSRESETVILEETADGNVDPEASGASESPEAESLAESGDEESAGSEEASEASDSQESDPSEGPDDPNSGEGAEKPARKRRLGPGNKLDDEELLQALTALLFASPEPLNKARLVTLLERPEPKRIDAALEALSARFVESKLPFVLREAGGGWRILTDPELGDVVARLARARKVDRISPAALETLAVVAYRQPVTKAEIEAIRGVQAGPILRTLVERGLARVTGRADQPGSPLQYGTTKEFLDRFALSSLKDLPRDGEIMRD